jgi:Holliday junction resolvase RusA-like endonuclease
MTRTSEFVVTVEPKPAPRPQAAVIKGHAVIYNPKTYKDHCNEIAASLPKLTSEPLMGELVMAIEFVCKPIAKSKFTTPAGDLDNLAKPLLDVLTKEGWYGDDRQIVTLSLSKRFPDTDETPHIRFQLTAIP